jgi:hypothetical protein
MKFREFKKTPNGFIIGKWYNGTCGIGRKCKWKIVDNNRFSGGSNMWKHEVLLKTSGHVYALCSDNNIWNENTVIKVGLESINRDEVPSV